MRLRDAKGGVRVRIKRGDPDETFPDGFEGRIGTIRGVCDPDDFGTHESPLLVVAVVGIGHDGFWLEELEVVR